MFKRLLFPFFTIGLALSAQTSREQIAVTPEKAGGVYYAYPVTEAVATPAPADYEPFYISHYGRHGSRYLISDDDYRKVIDVFALADENNALTPDGQRAYSMLRNIWKEAEGRGGELTPLGNRQHAAIAGRMAANYPEVFEGDAKVTARSTQVMRCAHSMFAFVEKLKELYPRLSIPRESGKKDMWYLCYWTQSSADFNGRNGEWRPDYVAMKQHLTRPDSLVSRLFSDHDFVRRHIVPSEFMWDFYWVAVGQQNIEDNSDLLSLFSNDELYDLWRINNFEFYVHNAAYPRSKGIHVDNAKNLLRHITENADSAIINGTRGATLRFGHDGNIVPLTALMKIENCYGWEDDPMKVSEAWRNFYVSPMASNVQLVFFRNPADPAAPVLVKILHNEKEVHIPVTSDSFPFYRWDDVRPFFNTMITTPFAETL